MSQIDQEALKAKHDEQLRQLAAQHETERRGLLTSHEQHIIHQQKQAESRLADRLQGAHDRAAADTLALQAKSLQELKAALANQSRSHQQTLQQELELQSQKHAQAVLSQAERYVHQCCSVLSFNQIASEICHACISASASDISSRYSCYCLFMKCCWLQLPRGLTCVYGSGCRRNTCRSLLNIRPQQTTSRGS